MILNGKMQYVHIGFHKYVHILNIAMYFTEPSALTVNITKDIESLSLVVQWNEVEDFTEATYTLSWTGETDHILKTVPLTEQTSYTITGLTLDTVYTIIITAANTCGNGPEFSTSVLLAADNTSTVTTVSPTVTPNTTDANSKCFKYIYYS